CAGLGNAPAATGIRQKTHRSRARDVLAGPPSASCRGIFGVTTTVDQVLSDVGTGPFQRRLLGIFGLVWAADAMQVLAVGFTAASIAATFSLSIPEALQTGTVFFLGMLIGAGVLGRLADSLGRRNILIVTVACDAIFGALSV